MVEATLDGKDSVSVVARRYDVNANQLFRWRRQYLAGQLQVKPVMPDLIPVQVNDTDHDASQSTRGSDTLSGQLQIILSNRHRVTITGRVCQQSLATILQALS
jgi:transposase